MTLTFYMKGGHRFRSHWVKRLEVTYHGDTIDGLTVETHWFANVLPGEKLFVASIKLADIQAITRS